MGVKNNFFQAVSELKGIIGTAEQEQDEKVTEAFTETEINRNETVYNVENPATVMVSPAKTESTATVISKSMVIVGEILSSGDIDIYGDVKGSIKTSGDINATGKIIGDLAGNGFKLNGCIIQGNINAKGDVVVGMDTVIIGDITADNIKINGKVKGNLNINRTSEFLENALLAGDVSSQTISMNQGAKLHGNVKVALDNAQSEIEFDSIPGIN